MADESKDYETKIFSGEGGSNPCVMFFLISGDQALYIPIPGMCFKVVLRGTILSTHLGHFNNTLSDDQLTLFLSQIIPNMKTAHLPVMFPPCTTSRSTTTKLTSLTILKNGPLL